MQLQLPQFTKNELFNTMKKLSLGQEIQCDAWQVEIMPWTAKQHLWKSKAKEGNQLSRGGPSNRQKMI